MTETEEIDKLMENSRNAYLHEKDAKLTKKLRIGALDDAFMCQMIGACEKYYTLMKELLDYPRRECLDGKINNYTISRESNGEWYVSISYTYD